MQAIATLLQDDPYLTTPIKERIAARRKRRAVFDTVKGLEPAKVLGFSVAALPFKPRVTAPYHMWFDDLIAESERQQLPKRPVRINDIQLECALFYGLSREDLLSAGRTAIQVKPRQVAMYLARQMLGSTYPELGRRFGGRDHTTVLHANNKISKLVADSKDLAAEIQQIKAAIAMRVA